MKTISCPKCGQGKIPFRYYSCFVCGYKFNELYIKNDVLIPSPDAYNHEVATPNYRQDLAELFD